LVVHPGKVSSAAGGGESADEADGAAVDDEITGEAELEDTVVFEAGEIVAEATDREAEEVTEADVEVEEDAMVVAFEDTGAITEVDEEEIVEEVDVVFTGANVDVAFTDGTAEAAGAPEVQTVSREEPPQMALSSPAQIMAHWVLAT
jgi:hypothetical protein